MTSIKGCSVLEKVILEKGDFFAINLNDSKNNRYFGEKNNLGSKRSVKTLPFKLDSLQFVSRPIKLSLSGENDYSLISAIYKNLNANSFTYELISDEDISGEVYHKIGVQFCNIPQKYIPKE
jgi:hypothetical protein